MLLLTAALFFSGCAPVEELASELKGELGMEGSETPLTEMVQEEETEIDEEDFDPWARFEVGSGKVAGFDLSNNTYYDKEVVTEEGESEPSDKEDKEDKDKKEGETASEDGASYEYSDEKNYCFSLLNADEKKVYLQIFNCFMQMSENVELATFNTEVVDKCFNYVMLDHPEIFYVYGYKITVTKRGEEITRLGITGRYSVDEDERRLREDAIEAKVNDILKEAPETDDEYKKVKFAYDYIVGHTDYDSNVEDNQNIVSVFLYGRSVCQGYSMAMKYLLDRMGVFCTLVYGRANNDNHSWNLVRMNGTYCFVDATWGDASYLDIVSGTQREKINYNYFGANDEILFNTHLISSPAPVPECTSLDQYYYVKEDAYFTSVDLDKLHRLFNKYRMNGTPTFTIKCSNKDVYEEFVAELLEGNRLFEFYEGVTSANYKRDNMEYTLTFNV